MNSDINHFNVLFPDLDSSEQSKYYSYDEYHSKFNAKTGDLKVLSWNVCSLFPKLDSVSTILDLLGKFDLICLSETWLTNVTVDLIDVKPYKSYHMIRGDGRRGGGVSILVNENYESKLLTEISCSLVCIESIFVEYKRGNKNIIVGSIYRPPGTDSEDFLSNLNRILTHLSTINSSCNILCGDFNYDILRSGENGPCCDFLNTMATSALLPMITKPNRISEDSFTLIDNIFVSNPIQTMSGIIPSDLSDHYPIFTNFDDYFSIQSCVDGKTIKYRLLTDNTIENLISNIASFDFSHVLTSVNSDRAIVLFDDIVKRFYNECCPIITKKLSYKDVAKPWIDREIKNKIKKRQNYLLLYKLGKVSRQAFNAYRNMVTAAIRKKRREYFKNKFVALKGNLKGTWKIINEIIRPNVKLSNQLISLRVGSEISDEPLFVSNEFNNYFSTVGSNIVSSINHSDGADFSRYLTGNYLHSFYFNPTTSLEVRKHIFSLKSKPCSIDQIPVSILKSLSNIISPILAKIVNDSMTNGHFPSSLKMAHIVPIHKSGSRNTVGNYRPISILSTYSKIFEKVVYSQLIKYLELKNILYSKQYGFRSNKSTTQAILNLLTKIYTTLDNGDLYFSLFLDFQKAFDCVSHEILLAKLYHYGIRGIPHQWFTSYLTDRKQCVAVNGGLSEPRDVLCGVPQGSNLGPLLFLIFINDLPTCTGYFDFCLFADDSTLSCIIPRSQIDNVHSEINLHLVHVHEWLSVNKIKLNCEKSKYVVFSYRDQFSIQPVFINNNIISNVTTIKYLGIHLDCNLTFNYHINHIAGKISKSIGMMDKISSFVPRNIMLSLYFSLINPYLTYCIEAWYNCAASSRNKLFVLQKRCIRCIMCADFHTNTELFFNQLNILKLSELHKFSLCIYIYKTLYIDNFDNSLYTYIDSNINNHLHNTRHSANITLPLYSRSKSQFCINYSGCNLWNQLQFETRNANSVEKFKALLMKELTHRV